MPLHQSDSIILKTYPLGEADRIVVFFSRDFGKVRGVANGARRMKNRFGASLEPLAHSRLMFFERENRELVRAVFAAQVVELTDKFLPEHEANDAAYRLVRMTMQAIAADCPLGTAACYFEVWMLRLAGMFPDLFRCSVCMRSVEAGEDRYLAMGLQAVVCGHCEHRESVAVHPEVPVVLQWILRNRLESALAQGILDGLEKGTRDLHELNQYWIRRYLER
jgi:DNA repair protein RecO (recombination protein O)